MKADPDIEDYSLKMQTLYDRWANVIPDDRRDLIEQFVYQLIDDPPQDDIKLQQKMRIFSRKHKFLPKKWHSFNMYQEILSINKGLVKNKKLSNLLVKKRDKSLSGVLVITVLTSPYPKVNGQQQLFTCKWNCYYCPNEPGQPRSYLKEEPAVLRANHNEFDPILQFIDRAATLAMMGHPVDKIELIVLGGTWASYPIQYREDFIRDLYYAANTFWIKDAKKKPAKKFLHEEKKINTTAISKIIGLTLETRPDCITPDEIYRFRSYGCTRLQLGLQHTDNAILKKINRQSTREDAVHAIQLLKDCGYKIDIHLMPNLPGSTPEKDLEMFNDVLCSDDLHVDQWKIYPTEIVPFTIIKKWVEDGSFVPYSDDELIKLLLYVKPQVHPWIRLNRVIRDIPSQYTTEGTFDIPNLRQDLLKELHKQGKYCKCIRCREVKNQIHLIPSAELKIRKYKASGGIEYFISMETPDEKTIFGFVRLRICNPAINIFPELNGCALIREAHVYGKLKEVIKKTKRAKGRDYDENNNQHTGFGKIMMKKAEEIAWKHGKKKMSVIAGIGAQPYYGNKLGYKLDNGKGEFMIKNLSFYSIYPERILICIMLIMLYTFFIIYTYF
jgi:ELP3 family radical SAM enzyme/protein acetyltransferase